MPSGKANLDRDTGQSIKELKALVEQRKDDLLVSSWKLGKLADTVLGESEKHDSPPLTSQKLAQLIGLIPEADPSSPKRDDSTLRQMIKFAQRASEAQARALARARVPWRGIISLISVENDQHFRELYQAMLDGLTNSTKIRRYIEEHFDHDARPRISRDLATAYQQAAEAADRLSAVLDVFTDVQADESQSVRAAVRRELVTALQQAEGLIRSTLGRL